MSQICAADVHLYRCDLDGHVQRPSIRAAVKAAYISSLENGQRAMGTSMKLGFIRFEN